ncbi:MAG: DUF2551 domain-containing protein [Methanomicrobiales archaeon]|nr:DUF2551 domain-containing protein [Methanomicrobiales archaeon]
MRSPVDFKGQIYRRLKEYLSRDRTGIRRALLALFIRMKIWTIPQIFEQLKQHFTISYHSIASMVGIIASRIGILRVRKSMDSNNTFYEMKEQYLDLVSGLVTS